MHTHRDRKKEIERQRERDSSKTIGQQLLQKKVRSFQIEYFTNIIPKITLEVNPNKYLLTNQNLQETLKFFQKESLTSTNATMKKFD